MAEINNCISCGATNQLPDGRTSMFCAYCGGKVEMISSNLENVNNNPLRTKPEISKEKSEKRRDQELYFDHNNKVKFYDGEEYEVITDYGGELSLIERGLNTLNEIICWYSDNELNNITTLNLKQNKIKSLEGINKFNSIGELDLSNNLIQNISHLNKYPKNFVIDILDLSNNRINNTNGLDNISLSSKLDLSQNDLKTIEHLPEFSSEEELFILEINFSYNKQLKSFSDELINKINNSQFKKFRIDFILKGCNNFELDSILNLKLSKFSSVFITVPIDLKDIKNLQNRGFNKYSEKNNSITFNYPSENLTSDLKCSKCGKKIYNKRIYDEQKGLCVNCVGVCFIATATMGSYDHPEVMQLRNFRDNWILSKKWGKSFVEWYYNYGAIAAKFIEKNYILKKLSYILIVKPLVFISRIVSF